MKYIIHTFALLLLLASCKSEPEATEVDAQTLQGTFVRVKNNGRGGKEKNDLLVESITFRSQYCNFTYDGTPMSGKYSVDEGYVFIEAGGELGTLSMEIVSENQLEGEGRIHGSFMREGFEGEWKKQSGNGEQGGAGAGTNGESGAGANGQSGEASNTNKDKTSTGSANGQQTPTTNTGTNNVSTTPNTNNATAARYVVKQLNTSNMRGPAGAKISLILTINAQGMVVGTKLDRAKTTTNNEVLVNSVTEAVKKEVRYNEVAGASNTKVAYTVKL